MTLCQALFWRSLVHSRLAVARHTEITVMSLMSRYSLSELACFTCPWGMTRHIRVHI